MMFVGHFVKFLLVSLDIFSQVFPVQTRSFAPDMVTAEATCP